MIKTVSGKYLEIKYVNICPLNNMGLCNQLYTLVGAILMCHQMKIPLLFVGPFRLEVNSETYSKIEKILHLDSINEYIRPKYKVGVFDVNTYAYKYHKKNLTRYTINPDLKGCFKLINTKEGNDILNNLYFQPKLVSNPMKFLNEKKNYFDISQLQIVHLRIEDDAILHWSSQNKMKRGEFFHKLCEKYTHLIEKHINKEDPILFLTGNIDNPVINYIKKHKYKYLYFTKTSKFREINAIMDLILGKMCSKVFIGAGGSTFSDMIHTSFKFDNRVKSYFVNLDNIINE